MRVSTLAALTRAQFVTIGLILNDLLQAIIRHVLSGGPRREAQHFSLRRAYEIHGFSGILICATVSRVSVTFGVSSGLCAQPRVAFGSFQSRGTGATHTLPTKMCFAAQSFGSSVCFARPFDERPLNKVALRGALARAWPARAHGDEVFICWYFVVPGRLRGERDDLSVLLHVVFDVSRLCALDI